MEVKTKQQGLSKQTDEVNMYKEKIEKELTEQNDKIERAQRSFQSKYNNVKSIKGEGFEDTKENLEIMLDMEQTKNKHLLNALA